MFESPVKQNLSSPTLATMCLLQSPESATRPAASVLLVLARGRDLSRSANAVSAGNHKFFLTLSFSTLVRGDPFRVL